MKTQHGFSLIEFIVSAFLSSLLVLIFIEYYLHNKQNYQAIQSQLEKISDIAWVNELIRTSIRHAGFTPCANIDQLEAFDHHKPDKPPTAVALEPTLTLSRMANNFTSINNQRGKHHVLTPNANSFKPGQRVLIADCFHAEVLTVKRIQPKKGSQFVEFEQPLIFTYIPPAFIGEWLEEQFFIDKNSQKQPALYYFNRKKEELTPLITALTASYNNHRLSVTFNLKDGKPFTLITRLRAP